MAADPDPRRRRASIEEFVRAFEGVVAVAPDEASRARRRARVDRAVPAAAEALDAVGAHVRYRAPGSRRARRVNPAWEWAAAVGEQPALSAEVVLACCHRALGVLDGLVAAGEAAPALRTRSPHWRRTLRWTLLFVVVPLGVGVAVAVVGKALGVSG